MLKHVYFKNLDGLRFIAAFFVILHHTDENLLILGHGDNISFHFPVIFGPLAVIFFFVLSGFLITYLLFSEKERTQNINLKAFYMRRILRIWPLYYLIIILALFVLPHIGFFNIPPYWESLQDNYVMKILLLVFFLPNLLYSINPFYSLPYADPLWSIGVEEQFYLLWPLLIKRTKNYPVVFLTIIAVFVVLTHNLIGGVMHLLLNRHITSSASLFYQAGLVANNFFSGWANFQIDAMAVGAMGAYLVFFNKNDVLKILFNPMLTRSLLVIFLVTTVLFKHYHVYLFYYAMFIIFILNIALNPKNKLNLEHAWLKYLGKISYGIYLLHPIAVTIAIKFAYGGFFNLPTKLLQFVVYVIAVVLSIGLASVSYYSVELAFLKMKNRFTV